eukprot:3299011-Pyramimonas_sp.AAC.1
MRNSWRCAPRTSWPWAIGRRLYAASDKHELRAPGSEDHDFPHNEAAHWRPPGPGATKQHQTRDVSKLRASPPVAIARSRRPAPGSDGSPQGAAQ